MDARDSCGLSYRGVRRRMRVRLRALTKVRTAPRNLDLQLAIGGPHQFAQPFLCPSADSDQCTAETMASFFCINVRRGFCGDEVKTLSGTQTASDGDSSPTPAFVISLFFLVSVSWQ
jgi:hypothetical protein